MVLVFYDTAKIFLIPFLYLLFYLLQLQLEGMHALSTFLLSVAPPSFSFFIKLGFLNEKASKLNGKFLGLILKSISKCIGH